MNVSRPLTTELLHRGALSADRQSLRPDPSLFERIGGRSVIERITDEFYGRIGEDPQLAPLFTHFHHARQTQKLFFEEWMGGEDRFSRGLIRGLQRSHVMIHISKQGAERWLGHLKAVLKHCDVQEALCSEVLGLIGPMALRLVNSQEPVLLRHPGPKQSKWFAVAAQLAAKGDLAELNKALTEDPSRARRRG